MKYDQFAPPLSEDRYAECFKTYREISSEWESMLIWIHERLLKSLAPKDNFSILSVGSGSGEFDLQLIQIFKSKVKNLEYIALDPSQRHCQQFKSRIASHLLSDVQFEIRGVACEKFNTERRFDLVHFTHCLYYIPDRQKAILKALNLTFDDGRVIIFHHTQQGINQIQRAFMKRVKGSEDEIFSSRELRQILDQCRISYSLDVIDSFLDVSECFRLDSEAGQNLLSFFLECDVRQLTPALKREIVSYIRQISFYDGEAIRLFHPVAVFSIFKNC